MKTIVRQCREIPILFAFPVQIVRKYNNIQYQTSHLNLFVRYRKIVRRRQTCADKRFVDYLRLFHVRMACHRVDPTAVSELTFPARACEPDGQQRDPFFRSERRLKAGVSRNSRCSVRLTEPAADSDRLPVTSRLSRLGPGSPLYSFLYNCVLSRNIISEPSHAPSPSR